MLYNLLHVPSCGFDFKEESIPESLPSDTDAETEQLVDTTELADEPRVAFDSTLAFLILDLQGSGCGSADISMSLRRHKQ